MSCSSPPTVAIGGTGLLTGRRALDELRVERRAEAAERAVVPRAKVGDMVGDGEGGMRLDDGGFALGEVVVMSCPCVGRKYSAEDHWMGGGQEQCREISVRKKERKRKRKRCGD